MRTIRLREFETLGLAAGELPEAAGRVLWQRYGRQVHVEWPSFPTGQQWRLQAQGWVGHIPLTPELGLALEPKAPLDNLFRMLEVAYRFKFEFLEGLVGAASLADFYERLAAILARRVLDRGRRGFYRAYVGQAERLPTLRGRLETAEALRRPWDPRLPCQYEEHTADVADNQILAWTLDRIARSGVCTERVLPTVRRAYRALQGLVAPTPVAAEACLGRLYHRLNDDYRPLHGLCRFFLEQSGPSHRLGDRVMLPFLVEMAGLYEKFVAAWLQEHLPAGLALAEQQKVKIDPSGQVQVIIDLVVTDRASGQALAVLDTKYKTASRPDNEDINQVAVYALARDCREAVLIYPQPLSPPLDVRLDDIRVRSATFALTGDLEENGRVFLEALDLVANYPIPAGAVT